MKKLKYIPLALIATSLLLQAQAPKIGDAIREAKPPKDISEPKAKKLIKVKGIKPVYKPKLQDNKKFKKVFVKSFNITGNIHIKSKLLLALINSYKNRELSFNDMQELATIITKEYRKNGYILARAYIPVQSMSDGVLEISVIEGVYGKFKLINNSKLKTSLLQKIFDTNKQGEVITNSSLERSMLIVNDIAGVRVSNASIQAGDEVGSSNFLITVDNLQLYNGYALVNNYGGRYTGKNQLIAGVNILNPFGIGDTLSLTGVISNGGDLVNGSSSYSFPINKHGLQAKLGYSNTLYRLSKEFANLDAHGHSQAYYLKLSYPLIKQKDESLKLSLKVEKNILRDEVRSTSTTTDKNLYAYRVGIDYKKTDLDFFHLKQLFKTSMILTQGNLKFLDTTQRNLDQSGADTEGVFSKVELFLNYDIGLTQKLSLENSLSYQHTLGNKNLDGSEDFSVGGAYGVKLYPSGELSAENGYLYKIEAKYALNSIQAYSSKVGTFYDIGRVYMQNPTTTFESKILQDFGVGYYANYKKFFANMQIAWKVGSEAITSEPDENYKILFMGGLTF